VARLIRDAARVARVLVWQAAALVAATALVAFLILVLGARDASAVYLLAVAIVAIRHGPWAAAGTALASFVLYNYLFIEPRYTFAVASPDGLITLLLLLGLSVLIGQLAGAQHDRAEEATRREREASSLALIARSLATSRKTNDALPLILQEVAGSAHLAAVSVGLGPTPAQEQALASHGPQSVEPRPAANHVLLDPHGSEGQPRWVRLSAPTPAVGRQRRAAEDPAVVLHRIVLPGEGGALGSVWFLRDEALGRPSAAETRMLLATAEQIAQGIRRDRLADQATELEVAIRSDELKSALLDSVSHDLRTPLASIRAAAGNLADPELAWSVAEQRAAAQDIDDQAERLSGLVTALLDMSRIRSGALRAEPEVLPADDPVRGVLARTAELAGGRHIDVDVPPDEPLLWVDPIFADQALTNLIENALVHTPADAPVRLIARRDNDGRALLVVEDGGPGIPDDDVDRVFEAFYRGEGAMRTPGGAGLGLAIVRGMVEAMGGHVTARRSELGGLAIELDLPAANGAAS
jgi:two-component system, OmpR family, sensor histidine kinase KdpD